MERKNTVLLTVIAVATLLVAVVGATFAYFTATSTTTGEGTKTGEVETTILGGTSFTFSGKDLAYDYLKYPGGLAVFGAKAEFTKTDNETDTNDYDLTFDLEINYTNETNDNLLWALYMVEGDSLETDLDPSCKLVSDVVGTETHYWYNDTGTKEEGEDETPTSCTLSASQKETLQSTTMIGYGYLKANQNSNTVINKETETQTGNPSGTTAGNVTAELYNTGDATNNPLKGRTLDTEKTKTKYYYLVVQYPNENSKQNEDEGSKTINVSLKVTTGSAAATLRKKAS